jgi:hypothetical protein
VRPGPTGGKGEGGDQVQCVQACSIVQGTREKELEGEARDLARACLGGVTGSGRTKGTYIASNV